MTRISKVKFPEAAPWVFGLLMLSPFEAVYAGALLSETLTALLLVGAAASLLLLSGWKRWILGGMVGGLCVLCRDIYLPMLLLFAGLWTWRGIGPPKHRILQAGVFLAASMIVIAPWTARNYYYLGQVVPVSAGRFGFAMWIGTWATDGAFTKSDATGTRVYPPQAYRTENERRLVSQAIEENQIAPGKGDAIFRSLAMARLRDEPRRVLVRALRRAPLLWFGTRFDIFSLNERVLPYGSSAWRLVKSILWGINAFFIVLGVLGIILAARRSSSVLWLAVPIFFTVGVYLPFGAFENRYSQPVYPFVLAFSGIAAAEIVKCYFFIPGAVTMRPSLGNIIGMTHSRKDTHTSARHNGRSFVKTSNRTVLPQSELRLSELSLA